MVPSDTVLGVVFDVLRLRKRVLGVKRKRERRVE